MHFGPVSSRALVAVPALLSALAAAAAPPTPPGPVPRGPVATPTLLESARGKVHGAVLASARADVADGEVLLLVATRANPTGPVSIVLMDFSPGDAGWELSGHDEVRSGALPGTPVLALAPDAPPVAAGAVTATVGWKAEDGRSEAQSVLYRRAGGRLTRLLAVEPDRAGGGDRPSLRHALEVLPTSTGGLKDLRVVSRECTPQGECGEPLDVASYTFDGVRYVRRPYAIPFVEKAQASSQLESAGAMEDYSGGAAVDGRADTAWCEGAPGPGWFQKLELRFVPAEKVVAVTILPGGPKGTAWGDWTRPKRVRLLLGEGRKVEADLADEPRPQRIAVPEGERVFGLTLVIVDVYKGKREDACIDEVELEVEP